MAKRKPKLTETSTLQGIRTLQRLQPLLERLRAAGCQRDRAGNRELFFDQVCSLILLTFFNPCLESLRDLHKASQLAKVKKKLGCQSASLGSLSEAMRVFDAQLLTKIVQELLEQIPDSPHANPQLKTLAHIPTAVDGSFLRHLPQITQACFTSRRDRGWKLHTHFEVLRGVPTFARVTNGSGRDEAGEKAVLRSSLSQDRCYITDRGYEEFALFNAIVAAGSSYVCRVRNDHQLGVTTASAAEPASEQNESSTNLPPQARAAGVLADSRGRLGSPNSKRIEHPDHDQRRIVVEITQHAKRGGRRRGTATQNIVLVTNLLDVPAEVIVLLYRYRWLIELFFRWLKCVLSCRHLVSHSENGIQIQMYCALLACLLIQLAAGQDVKPNQWTYKLLCLYAQGWASEEEVLAHVREQGAKSAATTR